MATDSKPKVICLGLGRTGTSSLRDALELLGFGPCYHFTTIMNEGGKDLATWSNIVDGNGTKEDIQSLVQGYGALLDYPVAMNGAKLYTIYPEAKYILTTRDPAKWEASMKSTILKVVQVLREQPNRSALDDATLKWSELYMMKKYHRDRIFTHTQEELLAHNERVKQIIPSEKLLIYEVGEGWERLVNFLGVSIPAVTFPHVNDAVEFLERWSKFSNGFN